MLDTKTLKREELPQRIFISVADDEYIKIDMTLPLQMLFDDVMKFVDELDVWKKFY